MRDIIRMVVVLAFWALPPVACWHSSSPEQRPKLNTNS